MDIEGLERLLTDIESGVIRIVARDLTEPSPLAREVLTARPYAYLDDAPLEELRTQAVISRRWLDTNSADEIGRLDAAAVTRVREEAWPDAANADELHDALVWLGFVTEAEADARENWEEWLVALAQSRRAALLKAQEGVFWVPAERLRQFQAVHPGAVIEPAIAPPPSADQALMLECDPQKCPEEIKGEKPRARAPRPSLWSQLLREHGHSVADFRTSSALI